MDKLTFILAQYRRTFGKVYENYCIERIINRINNPELIFITQKMFRRSNGGNTDSYGIALADLYFPQLKLTIEIDEAHHIDNKTRDAVRTKDILDKLSKMHSIIPFEPEEKRIVAYGQNLETINKQIDDIVELIKERIRKVPQLKWSILTTEDIIAHRKIDNQTEVSFRTIYEVSRLFNKGYKPGCQQGYFKVEDNVWCWCPKLVVADIPTSVKYLNEITLDEKIIYESHKDSSKNDAFVQECYDTPNIEDVIRYVFGYYQTEIGTYAYVFKGAYKFNYEESKKKNKRAWVKFKDEIDLSPFFDD